MFERTILAFGSESGNAKELAQSLFAHLKHQSGDLVCEALDDVTLTDIDVNDLLLVIASTFGDGAPPGNARAFAKQLSSISTVSSFQYAVFGLGDVGYPKFCQFGKTVDQSLGERGARRLVNRVDADLNYQHYFWQWQQCISDILEGKKSDGLDLNLNVEAYSESHPYLATVNSVKQIGDAAKGTYHLNLNISNSGMDYRAGDLLHVLPDDDIEIYSAIERWFGEDVSVLAGKELRILSKSLLRGLAKASGNKELKEKLKIKNKSALKDYLFERDLLDVLNDSGEPGFISVDSLAKLLPSRSPRTYWIASCGESGGGSNESLDLCVSNLVYQAFGRNHNGAASHFLCQAKTSDQLKVYMRSNPDFWLNLEQSEPILMICEGTGIAPCIGFLQALANRSDKRQTELFFGEGSQSKDSNSFCSK